MIGKLVSLLTSLTLLAVAFGLLWLVWSTERSAQMVSEYRLLFTLGALFLIFLGVINFLKEDRPLPSYTFNLLKGKSTVSIETLKKGIQTYVKSENPNLHVLSCQLKEGGKLLQLIFKGSSEPSFFDRLSNLLAEQFGFEGQLEIFFEKP